MITKEEVLEAIDVIEAYNKQEIVKIEETEKNIILSDTRSISLLELKTREYRSLRNADINTIGELLLFDRYELMKLRNLGRQGILLINKALKNKGIETQDFKANW